jgi:hypothetical protein
VNRAQALEACWDPFVVVPADVLVQCRFHCFSAEEPDVMEELFLQVAEEVRHHGIVGNSCPCETLIGTASARARSMRHEMCWY